MPEIEIDQGVQPPNLFDQLPTMVQGACGLDLNQAKVVVYWATATHGLPNLDRFPTLFLLGAPATGKSTIINILEQLAYQPTRVEGSLSKPELRDSLNDSPTVLIEEADDVKEWQIRNRYSRITSKTSVKRQRKDGGWDRVRLDLFGATVLHRRIPFQDPAVQSRAITVRTRKADGEFRADLEELGKQHGHVAALAEKISWDQVGAFGGHRIQDSWAPLLVVAHHIGDEEWLAWAADQMNQAEATLGAGQEEEPPQVIFSTVMSLALANGGDAQMQPDERVLLAEVVRALSDRNSKYNSWQIGQVTRDIGFDVRKAGGKQYVYIGGAERLVAIGAELGIQDEWLVKAAAELQA